MSEVVGEGVVKIRTDETGVDVDGAGKRAGAGFTRGFGSSLKGLAGVIGVTIAAAGAVDFLKDSVAEAREAQKVGAATTAIIKATGQAAGITADGIGDLASSLSAKTAVDDEQIQAGANLLLTFKNVKREGEGLNDVFGRATAAGLDLAAAGFGSIEGNAKQLGKALNDPTKGIAALGKAGVTFTEDQKTQIAGFVESNDLLSAQKIILGEVEKQVGGTAEATATSGEKAAVAFGNIKESVGTALLPVLDTLLNFFVDKIAPAIQDLINGTGPLAAVFKTVGDAISSAFGGGGGESAIAGIVAVVTSLAAQAVPLLQQAFAIVFPVVLGYISALRDLAAQVFPLIASFVLDTLVPAVVALAGYFITNVLPVFAQFYGIIVSQVIPVLGQIAAFIIGQVLPAIVSIYENIASNLKPVLDQLVTTFQTSILPAFSSLVEQIKTQLIPALEPLVLAFIKVIGFIYTLASAILGVVLPPLIRLAGFILVNVVPAVVSIITFVARFVGGLISLGGAIGGAIGKIGGFASSLVGLVKGGLDAVVNAVTGLPGRILALGGKLLEAGKTIIGKFLEGLKGVGSFASGIADAVFAAVRGVVNSAIDRLNGLLSFTIKVGPKSFTVDPPNIGHLQGGTESARAGVYTVGEVGPEQVYLPGGSRVLTAAQTRQAGAGAIDYDALAVALASVLGPLLAGQRPVSFMLPSGDPEAAAMAAINRLVTA